MSRNVGETLSMTPNKFATLSLRTFELSARDVLYPEDKKVFTINTNKKIPSLRDHHSPERKLKRMESYLRTPTHRQPSPKFNGDPDLRTIVPHTKEDTHELDINLPLLNTLRKPIHV